MKRSALVAVLCFMPVAANAACGDRGGPGYRGPNGKCVGWAALARVCGNPPSTRCAPEKAQEEATAAAEHGATIRRFMGDAHERAKK
jgi:hypothetical protein